MTRLTVLIASRRCAAGCSGASDTPAPRAAPAASSAPVVPLASMPKIDQQAILEHVKVLSSDEFEGRAPGTKGETLTVKYLEDQFKKLGLKPGNPDGTYVQKVPLVGITGTEARPLTITEGAQKQHASSGRTMWWRGRSTWRDGASIDGLRPRLRRLRRRGAGVQLERLQGRRRQGQDDRRPRQRSAGARSRRRRRSSIRRRSAARR